MKLLILLLAVLSVICDNFTMVTLSEANCILGLQYYNATSFNLINCYQFNNEIESTNSWNNCTQKCCDPDKTQQPIQSSLDICNQDRKKYNQGISDRQADARKQKYQRIQQIFMYTFVGVACLHLIYLIGNGIYNRYCQRSQAQHIIRDPSSLLPIQPLDSDISLNPFRPNVGIQWIKQRRRNEICPICLTENARVELAVCKHMMHWECWKEWSTRKRQCALCRSSEISQLKVFCYNCKDAYFICRNDDLLALATCPKIVCEECKGSILIQ